MYDSSSFFLLQIQVDIMIWLVFLPPLLVFFIGLLTHRIKLALFLGIIAAGLIATRFALLDSGILVVNRFWEVLEIGQLIKGGNIRAGDNIYIIAFLVGIGIIIEMICRSGGAKALVKMACKSIKGQKSAETSALVLSHCLFIDDYLSTLTVGSVLRPLTDQFRIARAKLAFLVDSMAAGLAIICPISSWAAAIAGFFFDNGISETVGDNTLIAASPSVVYVSSLPYIFYSFVLIVSIWVLVRRRWSYSVMRVHEEIATKTGRLSGYRETEVADNTDKDDKGNVVDFLVPFLSLLITVFGLLLYLGGYGSGRSVVDALQNAPTATVLCLASTISIVISLVYYFAIKRFSIRELPSIFYEGFRMMVGAIVVLLFAWTLGSLLRNDVQTGHYLALLIGQSLPMTWMPVIFFCVATVSALALGSAWGTTALLFPIAIPMIVTMLGVSTPADLSQVSLLFPIFGAILSGAVCGCNMSLMADTTIMSSTSSGCNQIDHINTQWRYILPVFVSTAVAFIIAGFTVNVSAWVSVLLSLAVAITLSCSCFKILDFFSKRKNKDYALE